MSTATTTPEFDIAIPRFVLGVASTDELVEAAHRTLERGVVTKSLIAMISTEQPPQMADVEPVFLAACDELGKAIPTPDDATWQVIRYFVAGIAHSEMDPRDAMSHVIREVEWNGKSTVRSNKYVGDSHDLQYLIGCYWGFDDLERPEVSFRGKHGSAAVRELEQHMIELAKEWLANHDQT